jgi:hypothetical protein
MVWRYFSAFEGKHPTRTLEMSLQAAIKLQELCILGTGQRRGSVAREERGRIAEECQDKNRDMGKAVSG